MSFEKLIAMELFSVRILFALQHCDFEDVAIKLGKYVHVTYEIS